MTKRGHHRAPRTTPGAAAGAELRGLGAPSRTEPHLTPRRPTHPLAPRGSPARPRPRPPPGGTISPLGAGGGSAPPRLPARPASPPRGAERPSAWRAAWSRPAQALAPPAAGRGRPGILRSGGGGCGSSCPARLGSARLGSGTGPGPGYPAAPLCSSAALPAPPGSAMKPAVLEVMRMNRVCRMVLVTSVGSFILVIFYFQSTLHPGTAPPPPAPPPVPAPASQPPGAGGGRQRCGTDGARRGASRGGEQSLALR